MKVLDQDSKDGYMKLEVESDGDLWHLKHVIEPGDVLRMTDQRTSLAGSEKKRCRLTLDVEKVDYQGNRLRATGEITEAPEDVQRGYHTFNLEPGVTFEVWKEEWPQYQLERVAAAEEAKDYEVLVCMIDKDGANLAVITEQGINEVSDVDSGVSGKMYRSEASPDAFYGQLAKMLSEYGDVDRIILAGPGFEKENLYDYLEAEHPELAANTMLEDASTTGTPGVQEVIKRGAIKNVLQQSRVADEVAAVEDLLEHLNKDDGLATYGLDPVREAVDMGAVETLLINDVLIHKEEHLMRQVEQMNGAVQIVHEDHDAGKKLASLGGVAAILRYRIE